MITIIAAVASNNAIGRNNQLIYWLPNDLRRFKQLTTGNTIIMGRRTFESLPKGALPNRRNLVLSRTATADDCPGCEVCRSLDEAIRLCRNDENIFIIGGATVYRDALPLADRLCLTLIDDTPTDADVFFPDFNDNWTEVWREDHTIDEKHNYPYSFVDYERK